MALEWDDLREKPEISSYSVFLNGERAGDVSKPSSRDATLQLTLLCDFNPVFKQLALCGEDDPDFSDKAQAEAGAESQTVGLLRFFTRESVIPKFGAALPTLEGASPDDVDVILHESDARRLFSHVLVGAGELVLNELKRIRYIGPIRTVPDRNFSALRSPVEGRWADGSAAWDELHHANETPPWLNAEQIRDLGLGYRIETYRYFEVPSQSVLGGALEKAKRGIVDSLADMEGIPSSDLLKIQSRSRLLLVTEENDVEVSPSDVGVGVSQLLPVVIGAMKPG